MSARGDAKVTRYCAEVMSGDQRHYARVTRVGAEVMSGDQRHYARVTRLCAEVMCPAPIRARVTRVGAEVMSNSPRHFARVTRLCAEVMSPPWPRITAFPVDPLQDFLPHNWVDRVSIECHAPSDLSAGEETLSEARLAHSSKPYRTIKCRWSGLDQATIQKLWGRLLYIGDHYVEVPLYPDYTYANSGCTTLLLTGSFSNRRFHNGGKVVVYYADGTQQATIVVSASSSQLILSSSDELDVAPSAGDIIVPVCDCWPNLSDSMKLRTDRVGDLTLVFDEIPGPSALPFSAQTAPSSFDTYDGLPVVDLDYNWVVEPDLGFARSGFKATVGKSEHSFLQGPSPQITLRAARQVYSKEEAWTWLNFFDSRRGRVIPYWAVLPHDIWHLEGLASTSIQVSASGKWQHTHNYLKYIAVYDQYGFVEIARVSQVIDTGGGVWTIDLLDTLSAHGEIVNVRWCIECRQSSDSYSDEWSTDQAVAFGVEITEILNEREVSIDYIEEGVTVYAPMLHMRVSLPQPTTTPA